MTTLDRYFSRLGKCAFCGTHDARHRTIDAIKERHEAGETITELADDYDLPVEAIQAAIDVTDEDVRLNTNERNYA